MSVRDAFRYLSSTEVPQSLYLRAYRIGAMKADGDLSSVNSRYHDTITSALIDYFEGRTVVNPRNRIRNVCYESFYDAFYMGYKDGGGSFPLDEDAQGWLDTRVVQELSFIDSMMQDAKALRKEDGFDYFSWATARADGYTSTLQAIYNAGVLWAKGNQKLTWNLGNTEKHCDTCAKLDGSTHRASWYISRNYIPRKPGASMDCGGYHCDCYLTDPKGETVTL